MIIRDKKPAEKLFRQFCEFYTARDLKAVLQLCSENITLWGTGKDEQRTGIAEMEVQLRRDWSQSTFATLELISFLPSLDDSLWAAGLCKTQLNIDGKDYVFENLRGSIVLAEEKGKLKIIHMHASFPDLRNPEAGSFPVK